MKIALYLGSFNPFHNGHLEVVETALRDFHMNGVVIVPSMQNPWKKEKALDIHKRIQIINSYFTSWKKDLDIPGGYQFYKRKGISTTSIEKELIPPYYSYATLHALKNKYCNDEVFILCGEDTIKDIPDWMNGEQIIKDYNFLIVDRPKNSISSTEIRNKVRNGEDISKYVNKNVIDLIKNYYK